MSVPAGYAPASLLTWIFVAWQMAGTLSLGLCLTQMRPQPVLRWLAWGLAVCNMRLVDILTLAEPAGLRMLAVCAVLLFSMKAVVSVEERLAGAPALKPWAWLAFAAAWPGMQPSLFASAGSPPLPGAAQLALNGLGRMFWGALLLILAHQTLAQTRSPWLATLLLLPALSLLVHFGLFNVVAGLWRWAGVDCQPLFQDPLPSRTLAEFWGRRWNLAFSQMSRLAVYQPLSPRLGKSRAALAAFLFSGLLHELAISLPVQAGFGLPSLYFALHGAALLYERRLGRSGRRWVLVWLLLPLPLLFHPPFLQGVVWPIIGVW